MTRVEDLLRSMASVRAVPYLDDRNYAYNNLGQLVATILGDYRNDLYQVAVTREKNIDEIPKRVLVLTGLPGSGKSHFDRIVTEYIKTGVEKYKWLQGTKHTSVTWERDGEDRARNKGLVTTPADKPFRFKELKDSDTEMKRSTAEAIKNSFWVTLEVPADTAVKIEDQWFGRSLGSEVVHDLARGEGEFKGLLYIPYFVGFVAGPLLRHVLVYSRDEFKAAESLQKAVDLAYVYGKEAPVTQADWDRLRHGATIEQRQYIEKRVSWLMDFLEARRKIKKPPRELFHFAYPPEIANLISEKQSKEDYESWSMGSLIDFIFRDKDNLNLVNPEQRFVGYNSPIWQELNIPDIEKLAEHIRGRGEFIP